MRERGVRSREVVGHGRFSCCAFFGWRESVCLGCGRFAGSAAGAGTAAAAAAEDSTGYGRDTQILTERNAMARSTRGGGVGEVGRW